MGRPEKEVLRELVGTPYEALGREAGPTGGIDCLGVVLHWWREVHGKEIHDPLSQDARAILGEVFHKRWERVWMPEPDCVISFELIGQRHHLGVLTRFGVLHAAETKVGVIVTDPRRIIGEVKGYYRPK